MEDLNIKMYKLSHLWNITLCRKASLLIADGLPCIEYQLHSGPPTLQALEVKFNISQSSSGIYS